MTRIRKAVIPAAGLGTRFYPLTRSQPKELLPIVDKPVIQYVVEEIVASGIDEILIITGRGKEALTAYFEDHPLDEERGASFGIDSLPPINFVHQRQQRGLADAVRYAKHFVGDEPFALVLGDTIYTSKTDVPVTAQLLAAYGRLDSPVIAVEKVPREKISDYGIIGGKETEKGIWKIDVLVEKPEPQNAPSDLGITGTYMLTTEIFEMIDRIKPGKNGEYQLTDALTLLQKERPMYGVEFKGTRYDIGTKELWIKAFAEFTRKDVRFSNLI